VSIGIALRSGERFGAISWAGLIIAFGGLIYLVSPGVTAPDPLGALLMAAASGGVASGIGYAIWYKALQGLTATRAATVQLSVPAIAALGGVLLIAEGLTTRLVVASAATLGGVWIVLAHRAESRGLE